MHHTIHSQQRTPLARVSLSAIGKHVAVGTTLPLPAPFAVAVLVDGYLVSDRFLRHSPLPLLQLRSTHTPARIPAPTARAIRARPVSPMPLITSPDAEPFGPTGELNTASQSAAGIFAR